MSLTRARAWRPDVYDAFAGLRARLMSNSTLSKRDLAVLVCATAAELGDSYCSLAWGSWLTSTGCGSQGSTIERFLKRLCWSRFVSLSLL